MAATSSQIKISPSDVLDELIAAELLIPSTPPKTFKSDSFHTPLVVTVDSRLVNAQSLFIAIKGGQFDGHESLGKVKEVGFSLIENPAFAPKDTPYLLVKNTRAAWSAICSKYFGHPQKNLKLIGITGTNGKTSTVWYVREILRSMGHRCASIGTLGMAFDGDIFSPTPHTTPDPPVLFQAFAKCVEAGISYVVMEVSSHGLSQQKVFGCEFAAAGFTSFSRDHLDHHGTMESYFATKMELFNIHLKTGALAVVHAGLKERFTALAKTTMNSLFYMYDTADLTENTENLVTIKKSASVKSKIPFLHIQKNTTSYDGQVPLYGITGIENFGCAFLITNHLAGPLPSTSWPKIRGVPGRLEYISSGWDSPFNHPKVFVDYAHTPDAVEKLLQEGRRMLSQENNAGRLVVVFGCGGDRDQGKRPITGKIAVRLADQCFVTSDNPRTEDPMAIINQITSELSQEEKRRVVMEVDRRNAIYQAIHSSSSADIVLIAGKGHEPYQEINGVKTPFDDREVAKSVLQLKPH